jgi:hypothetical protein
MKCNLERNPETFWTYYKNNFFRRNQAELKDLEKKKMKKLRMYAEHGIDEGMPSDIFIPEYSSVTYDQANELSIFWKQLWDSDRKWDDGKGKYFCWYVDKCRRREVENMLKKCFPDPVITIIKQYDENYSKSSSLYGHHSELLKQLRKLRLPIGVVKIIEELDGENQIKKYDRRRKETMYVALDYLSIMYGKRDL